jgi:hypothetical protein
MSYQFSISRTPDVEVDASTRLRVLTGGSAGMSPQGKGNRTILRVTWTATQRDSGQAWIVTLGLT